MDVKKFVSNNKQRIILVITMIATILVSVLPMKLCPIWNGEIPEHRNQYELLADAFLDGHLYIDYPDIDEKLLKMDNPYDPDARKELGVAYHWDHAFYKGKYYVYFGVAPVFIIFIPYKILTGRSLTTYHATQFFTALFIIGIFILFYNLYKYFYKKMKFSIYLFLSSALSILSIWICISTPALYCTAISAGLAMVVWSLYFYIKAVYGDNTLNKSIVYATIGAFFGAVSFACRPPLGLVNILAIPLVVTFFKKYKLKKEVILKVLIVAIPYVVIGSLLMLYNYVRFDSAFEFGQSYQLTIADQHTYTNLLSRIDISSIMKGIIYNFFEVKKPSRLFPFIKIAGAFMNYPLLIVPYILFLNKRFRSNLTKKKMKGFYIVLMILPIIITIMDVVGSPFLTERYRLDIYFLLSILTFISIINFGSIYINKKNSKLFTWACVISSILCLITTVLLVFVPYGSNFTTYYPNINNTINAKIRSLIK